MAKLELTDSILLEGEFELLSDAQLAFQPDDPSDYQGLLNQEHKLIVFGEWEIDPQHDLRFRVQESLTERLGKELVFKGEFLKAEAGELDFTYRYRIKEGKEAIRTFRFFGKWEADKNNRLTFVLNNSKGSTQTLTLNGAWKINKRHEIVYSYRKQELKTKTKKTKRLVFRGKWIITNNRSVSYVLEGNSVQAFRFRLTFETPIILANQNEIRFQIGVEVTGRRYSKVRDIVLFGKWKLKRDFSLAFEVTYRNAVWYEISFDAKYKINDQAGIEATLFARNGEDLGLAITLSRSFLDQEGEVFLSLEKSLEETRLEVGASLRF